MDQRKQLEDLLRQNGLNGQMLNKMMEQFQDGKHMDFLAELLAAK